MTYSFRQLKSYLLFSCLAVAVTVASRRSHPCYHLANSYYSNSSFSSKCSRNAYSEVLVGQNFELFACISRADYDIFRLQGHETGRVTSGYHSDSLMGFITDAAATQVGSTFSHTYAIDFDHGRRVDIDTHICYSVSYF
jgi:hypothetical protein